MENYQNKKSFPFYVWCAYCLFFSPCWTWKHFYFLARTSPVARPKEKGWKQFFIAPKNRLLNIQKITIFHLLVFIHNSSSSRLWVASAIIFEGFLINKKEVGHTKYRHRQPPRTLKTLFAVMGIRSLKCRFVENVFLLVKNEQIPEII